MIPNNVDRTVAAWEKTQIRCRREGQHRPQGPNVDALWCKREAGGNSGCNVGFAWLWLGQASLCCSTSHPTFRHRFPPSVFRLPA